MPRRRARQSAGGCKFAFTAVCSPAFNTRRHHNNDASAPLLPLPHPFLPPLPPTILFSWLRRSVAVLFHSSTSFGFNYIQLALLLQTIRPAQSGGFESGSGHSKVRSFIRVVRSVPSLLVVCTIAVIRLREVRVTVGAAAFEVLRAATLS
ncbi:hypothetical protein SNOG_03380 [Parastagonospora nodorum SN15]|uniref:Uncharacterized protein n=1 Tax=Phaeosphaeria nodorum (strain SN15 / ATCC MYA-4574 / FGSC 10173) TaxID=321614 RepID=Q0UXY4_PHANO|nr:hypothetical protein SNOG_03380 [Parastagonospora nodorum SN15]EAT88585.1 hypothetical protein SNOG_03380 [Parastagonospora nodorum SN15]